MVSRLFSAAVVSRLVLLELLLVSDEIDTLTNKEKVEARPHPAPRRKPKAMVAAKRDSATTIKALCWKNWLVARKNKRWNLVSILVPIGFACLLAVLKAQFNVPPPRPPAPPRPPPLSVGRRYVSTHVWWTRCVGRGRGRVALSFWAVSTFGPRLPASAPLRHASC